MPEPSMFVRDPRELRRAISRRGVSNRELAKAVGYQTHSYVNRIASGNMRTVTPQRARAIARFLQVDVDTLFVAETSTPTRRSVKIGRAS